MTWHDLEAACVQCDLVLPWISLCVQSNSVLQYVFLLVCAGVQVRLESVHVKKRSGNVCARVFGFRV